ncbi:ATP citrate (Pro-S)-lyase [Puccinia sorghi]|uniref:ATP citrate (Pro-S)-lyase n=1 Tax=Puccinia sorghi TaxID=27349 RepID=A0A0L6V472_9BASI|nr:ATP citrate (Pro-S)-lyase [Puccinia sorghi]
MATRASTHSPPKLRFVTYKHIFYIIKAFRQLPPGPDSYLCSPKDIRTITKQLRLDPKLDSHICCPSCFTLYEPEDAPLSCTYRKSARSSVCEEALFTRQTSTIPIFQPTAYSSKPRPPPFRPFTPRLVYHTQDFATWLKWFLNVPGIEDEIACWKEKPGKASPSGLTDNYFAMNFDSRVLQHHWQICWDPESNSITADRSIPSWVFTETLVVKPDQLIKCRGKAGLLGLNKTWPEAKAWIQERAGKPVNIEGVVGTLNTFIVKLFTPHPSDTSVKHFLFLNDLGWSLANLPCQYWRCQCQSGQDHRPCRW